MCTFLLTWLVLFNFCISKVFLVVLIIAFYFLLSNLVIDLAVSIFRYKKLEHDRSMSKSNKGSVFHCHKSMLFLKQ